MLGLVGFCSVSSIRFSCGPISYSSFCTRNNTLKYLGTYLMFLLIFFDVGIMMRVQVFSVRYRWLVATNIKKNSFKLQS